MSDPRSSRPSFPDPEEYGPLAAQAGVTLRSWDECRSRLEAAESYWLATTRRDGRPHAVPIGAVWLDERLWFNTSPQTVMARTLVHEPRAVIHLESADDVLIVEGVTTAFEPEQVPVDVIPAYTVKNGGEWDREGERSPWLWFSFDPRSALSWTSVDIRNTAIRYDFD